jgi:hypothetical protein
MRVRLCVVLKLQIVSRRLQPVSSQFSIPVYLLPTALEQRADYANMDPEKSDDQLDTRVLTESISNRSDIEKLEPRLADEDAVGGQTKVIKRLRQWIKVIW